jgi:hypothetical protein
MEDHRLDKIRVLRAASGWMLNPNFIHSKRYSSLLAEGPCYWNRPRLGTLLIRCLRFDEGKMPVKRQASSFTFPLCLRASDPNDTAPSIFLGTVAIHCKDLG